MIDATIEMIRQRGDLQFVIALASEKSLSDVKRILHLAEKRSPLPESLFIIAGETFDVLNASDAAAVTSGTATLETAIIGTPMAIVYKTSAVNYALLRPLISVEHFGLVNLIAGERVATEMIQNEFTPLALSRELFQLLEPEQNKAVRMQLSETTKKLGSGGASARAAQAIMALLDVEQTAQK
jgi:lipid-A-disaccharide synthase